MRKQVFIAFMLLAVISVSAQEKGKVRFGFDGGISIPNSGVGMSGDVDFRYNVQDNFNLGVRLGLSILYKDMGYLDNQNMEFTTGMYTNFLVHGAYYFAKENTNFAPFVDAGLGSFSLLNLYTVTDGTQTEFTLNSIPSFDKKFGGMISAGFEVWKFRLAAEYYIIPVSRRFNVMTESFDSFSKNSFFNLSLGFYFGGGSWKKKLQK